MLSRPQRRIATTGKISTLFVEVVEGHTIPRTLFISVVRNLCVVVVNFQKRLCNFVVVIFAHKTQ
jgi:hypothetical protein